MAVSLITQPFRFYIYVLNLEKMKLEKVIILLTVCVIGMGMLPGCNPVQPNVKGLKPNIIYLGYLLQ